MPFGVSPSFTALPVHPMHQFIDPGGCCTSRNGDVTFHPTDQPISQPCPLPIVLLLENASPCFFSVVPGSCAPSTSRPVAQRWCGATPAWSAVKFSTTRGPVTCACVTTGHVPSPVTAQRFSRICVPEIAKSAGAAAPLLSL